MCCLNFSIFYSLFFLKIAVLSVQFAKFFRIYLAKFRCLVSRSYSSVSFSNNFSSFSAIRDWLKAIQSSYFFVDFIAETGALLLGGLKDLNRWGWTLSLGNTAFFFVGELNLNYSIFVGLNCLLRRLSYYSNCLCNYSKLGTSFAFICSNLCFCSVGWVFSTNVSPFALDGCKVSLISFQNP
jgi:hypothetical protein